MSLATDYPRIFCDRCDISPVVNTKVGGSDNPSWPTITQSDVPCIYDPAQYQEIGAAKAVGVQVNSHIYFGSDPGRLPTQSRLTLKVKNGVTLDPPIQLSVVRVEPETMADLTVFRADCLARS